MVFANECARCHGQRGEGVGSAPAILGPGALQARPAGAAWRDQFLNAQDLFNFTSTHMPKGNAGKLPRDYWVLVSFMLAVQGANVPANGPGPANASSILIPAR
jgi:cytochrome c